MRRLVGIVLGVLMGASVLSGCSVIYRSEDAKRGQGSSIRFGEDRPEHSAH
ncbi:MAG TPA: hypothetical protein VGL09_05305 [Methylomirabilota bacterium]